LPSSVLPFEPQLQFIFALVILEMGASCKLFPWAGLPTSAFPVGRNTGVPRLYFFSFLFFFSSVFLFLIVVLLIYPGQKSFLRYVYYKYFLSVCILSFYFLNGIFWWARF
jgi:hypothetical protein